MSNLPDSTMSATDKRPNEKESKPTKTFKSIAALYGMTEEEYDAGEERRKRRNEQRRLFIESVREGDILAAPDKKADFPRPRYTQLYEVEKVHGDGTFDVIFTSIDRLDIYGKWQPVHYQEPSWLDDADSDQEWPWERHPKRFPVMSAETRTWSRIELDSRRFEKLRMATEHEMAYLRAAIEYCRTFESPTDEDLARLTFRDDPSDFVQRPPESDWERDYFDAMTDGQLGDYEDFDGDIDDISDWAGR